MADEPNENIESSENDDRKPENIEKSKFKTQEINSPTKQFFADYQQERLQKISALISGTVGGLKYAINGISKVIYDIYDVLNSQVSQETIDALTYTSGKLCKFIDELLELEPFIKAECKEMEKENPELDFSKMTMDELFSEIMENGESKNSLAQVILDRARERRKAANSFPKLQSTGTPKYYMSPNTVLANALRATDGKGEVIGAGALDLPIANIGKKSEITVYVNASLENMDNFKITGKPYSEYDRAVYDAVSTIFDDRIKNNLPPIATPDMIYRVMTHKTAGEYVSPQQKGAVTKSIDKMRKHIYVYADLTEEMKKRGIVTHPEGKTDKEKYSFILDDFLLSGRHFDNLAVGDENVSGYLFNEPLLLHHAKLTKQLITVKGEMLDIHEVDKDGHITSVSLPNTEKRIAIKSCLLRRVEVIKNDESKATDSFRKYLVRKKKDSTLPDKKISDFRKQSHVILFDYIFTAADITAANSKTKSKNYVLQVLDYWKARNDIKGYKTRKKGKTIDAIIIEP